MGIKSAKKSNTTKNHSNGDFTIGGLVFPSYELFSVLYEINKNLSLFYIATGEAYDYEPRFDSPARYSEYFGEKYDDIKSNISDFKKVRDNDVRVGKFLYNNRLSDKFSSLFESIYKAFIEAIYSGDDFDNEIKKMQNKKIKKIVRKLAYCGIDPFSPHKV